MTRTETTTTPQSRQAGTKARAHRSGASDCHCGQQLDYHARAHCPRCGRSLLRL